MIEEEFVNDPQIISIIPKADSYSLELLWAILNSKLATFYHFNSSPKATKGAFPKILIYDVNNFPLPENLSSEIDEKLKTLVNEILEIKKSGKEANTSKKEAEIDGIVYGLYGLSEEEIEIIESSIK